MRPAIRLTGATHNVRILTHKWGVLLLAFPCLFYLALPTRNYYWDGVAFAIDIEKHPATASLLHPSHLLYELWGAWLYGQSEHWGVHTRALFLMQAANSLTAGLCVVLLYKCLRLRRVPAPLAIPMALIFAFSATWWRFATDADAYVPSVFLMLCAYLLIHRPKTIVLAGFAHAGAMAFHELAFLLLPVALVSLRKSRRRMCVYTVSAVIPAVAAYVFAYISLTGKVALFGLLSWATSHSPDSGFSFHPPTNIALSIRGTFRLFFGGRPGDFAGDGISWAALLAFLAAAVLWCAGSWRAAREGAEHPPAARHLWIWAGVYAAFLFVWLPQNTFYRLFYLPALIMIVATMLRDGPRTRRATWLFVPVVLLWNFVFAIYPQSRPQFNEPLRFALAAQKIWAAGTPIVFHRFHPDLWIISYFNPQGSWIGIERSDVGQLEQELGRARSQKSPLWLEETAYSLISANPDGQRWLAVHERPGELLEFRDEKHHFRFHCLR